ncbi:hypothetical protein D9M70_507210 [compost metagenome]
MLDRGVWSLVLDDGKPQRTLRAIGGWAAAHENGEVSLNAVGGKLAVRRKDRDRQRLVRRTCVDCLFDVGAQLFVGQRAAEEGERGVAEALQMQVQTSDLAVPDLNCGEVGEAGKSQGDQIGSAGRAAVERCGIEACFVRHGLAPGCVHMKEPIGLRSDSAVRVKGEAKGPE